jgi:hypothetical protein
MYPATRVYYTSPDLDSVLQSLFREAQKSFPVDHDRQEFGSGKKDSNAKKESFAARNLKDCSPNLPLKTGKAKKKIKVFVSRQFYALCFLEL